MQIDSFIDSSIPKIRPTDYAKNVLYRMRSMNVQQLPVVNHESKYQGILPVRALNNEAIVSDDTVVSDLDLLYAENYAIISQHIFEILQKAQVGMDFIPVVNQAEEFVGTVSLFHVTKSLIKSYSIQQKGAVVELLISERNYSLAHLSALAESHYLKIIGLLVHYDQYKCRYTITLKLNNTEIKHYLKILERFDYHVTNSYTGEDIINNYDQKRLDLFLKYLQI